MITKKGTKDMRRASKKQLEQYAEELRRRLELQTQRIESLTDFNEAWLDAYDDLDKKYDRECEKVAFLQTQLRESTKTWEEQSNTIKELRKQVEFYKRRVDECTKWGEKYENALDGYYEIQGIINRVAGENIGS